MSAATVKGHSLVHFFVTAIKLGDLLIRSQFVQPNGKRYVMTAELQEDLTEFDFEDRKS